jgi:hypothetical protein
MVTGPPEVTRLGVEAVRIVSIPIASGFSSEDEQSNLMSVVRVGLGNDLVTKKRVVEIRLKGEGVGKWECPKLSKGHKGAPIHAFRRGKELRYSGFCQWPAEEKPGELCGRRLIPLDTHWHEFAEAFGFLESSRDNYIRGKFGLVANYLIEAASDSNGYFGLDRAARALYLYALLERHGDFVLPVLAAFDKSSEIDKTWSARILDVFRSNLQLKLTMLDRSSLPRNQGFFTLKTRVEDALYRKFVDPPPSEKSPKHELTKDTQYAYPVRTRTFLQDTGIFEEKRGVKVAYEFTELGHDLVSALNSEGMLTGAESRQIPPSFEAIHDAFSVTWQKYADSFTPAVSCQIFEQIIMRTVLPNSTPVYWKKYEGELAGLLPRIIRSVGNRIADGARIDTVRLALFLHQIGKGQPVLLDNQLENDGPANPNNHAVAELALKDPSRYMVGHARTGRRLWTVALLRHTP